MITTIADSWSVSVGGGWIGLMLIGMALCFVFMIGSMWLTRDGRGWAMCSRSSMGRGSPDRRAQEGPDLPGEESAP